MPDSGTVKITASPELASKTEVEPDSPVDGNMLNTELLEVRELTDKTITLISNTPLSNEELKTFSITIYHDEPTYGQVMVSKNMYRKDPRQDIGSFENICIVIMLQVRQHLHRITVWF